MNVDVNDHVASAYLCIFLSFPNWHCPNIQGPHVLYQMHGGASDLSSLAHSRKPVTWEAVALFDEQISDRNGFGARALLLRYPAGMGTGSGQTILVKKNGVTMFDWTSKQNAFAKKN